MQEPTPTDTPPDDDLEKEFDEIVEHADEEPVDDGATSVPVRHDSDHEATLAKKQEAELVSSVMTSPERPAPVAEISSRSSGGVMVLQWLSYAFWGWFGVAMGWLSAVTIAYFVQGNSSDITSALAYPLASVIVMFILAASADLLYVRREPLHKQGGASAIMLIHTVLFVLIAVGAAVTALFALISMLLNTDPSVGTDTQVVTAWTSLVLVVIFAMSALRVLFGGRLHKLRTIHWVVMAVLALGMMAAAIMGPVVGAQVTKDDRLIEEGLPTLVASVSAYVGENKKLPETLADANDSYTYTTTASRSLVSRNMVKYTKNVTAPITINDNSSTYYYRVCVTFTQIKKASGTYSDSSGESVDGYYPSYLTISSHPKGEVCYNRSATTGYGEVYPVDAASGATTK
jgi:hypothetical protein